MKNELYSYHLPEELLARTPASPRDSARLFVYDTASDSITLDTFNHLGKYLPVNSLLVLNNTKVIPARLPVTKETGGKAELLLLPDAEWGKSQAVKAMSNRKLEVGQKVFIAPSLWLEVTGQDKNIFTFKASFSPSEWERVLDQYGITPVPPYLLPTPLPEEETRRDYQTVFASIPASVAAPTASLHFTTELLQKLKEQGIGKVEVTLHVGIGTFAPVTEEHIQQKKLHGEIGEITPEAADTINTWKKDKKVVAVGTTATRLLEAHAKNGKVTPARDETDLFIMPPYQFQVVDALITNFHLSESSLMMLVEAFLQHKGAKQHIQELYETAIKEKFRFYSFGDAMLIL